MIAFRKNVVYRTENNTFACLVGYANSTPILKHLGTEDFFIPVGKCEVVATNIEAFYLSIARMFTPETNDASTWTMARWKAEIWVLANRTFQEIEGVAFEDHLDWTVDKAEIKDKLQTIALAKIKECEFFGSSAAKTRCLEHSPSVIDLTKAEIMKYNRGSEHNWQTLRDATFFAATVKDVLKQVGKMINAEIKENDLDED